MASPQRGDDSPIALGKRQHRSRSPTPLESKQARFGASYSNGDTTPTSFKIALHPVSHYAQQQPPAPFQLPISIASFSYDGSRKLHHDDRSRRYYHAPPSRADLNRGYEDLISRDDSINEHLDSLLLTLMRLAKEDGGKGDEYRQRANLITWRGMMTKLCTLLYEDRQGFEMNAMMVGDTLYLEEHINAATQAENERQQGISNLKRFAYYGYSFESWTCSERPNPKDPWDGNVNTNVQWCSVVKTKLGETRCILAGEVDAVDPKTQAPTEVKTSMSIRNARDEERFETKMLRFYMQSFLLGIAMVVVGFRDYKGFLVTHQEFQTLKMPRLVRGKPHEWNPTACLNFASDTIASIRSHISASSPQPLPTLEEAEKSDAYPVQRIRFDIASKEIIIVPLSPVEIKEQVKGGNEEGRVGFLLSDYYKMARLSLIS
ncbi:hypothetical protein CBS101457_005253 [Exobasidium rhododendri]|nr:hypothetical protein CBS101457_005253 [Exobasidium rhododendri]